MGLRNEVRGAFGADPIDPYDESTRTAQEVDKSEAARHELLRQTNFD